MKDTRFYTDHASVEDLFDGVDIDSVDDLETLFIFLLARPVKIDQWVDGLETVLEIAVCGNGHDLLHQPEFPLSVVQPSRDCADLAEELGLYTRSPNVMDQSEAARLSSMSDEELLWVTATGARQRPYVPNDE